MERLQFAQNYVDNNVHFGAALFSQTKRPFTPLLMVPFSVGVEITHGMSGSIYTQKTEVEGHW